MPDRFYHYTALKYFISQNLLGFLNKLSFAAIISSYHNNIT